MNDGEFLSGNEIAELLTISPQRVSALCKQGVIHHDGKCRYPAKETLKALFGWYQSRVGEGRSAKDEKLVLETQILRLTLQKTMGDLLPRAAVERAWAHLVLLARQKLQRIGNKLASRIMYLKDDTAIENEIQGVVDEALVELSRPVEYEPEAELDPEGHQ